MQNDIDPQTNTPVPGHNNGKVIAGFVLLMVGGLLLLEQLCGLILPRWVISFPSLMIVVGLYSGAKHNFRNPFAYILLIVGGICLIDDIFPDVDLSNLIWPMIIISIGIFMILKRNHNWGGNRWDRKNRRKNRWNENMNWNQNQQYSWDKKVSPDEPVAEPVTEDANTAYSNPNYSKTGYGKTYKGYPIEDYLDATSIFGSANKTIFTKTFRGGEIVNIFGGAEIDFTQSDINGQVVIDVTQIFGGIKLLVPPHWHVTSDTVSLFAGFDDKRKQKTNLSSDKILMITGTSIFAGIEIRSY